MTGGYRKAPTTARSRSSRPKMSPHKRKVVWKKSNGHCWYCGVDVPVESFTVDHIAPRSRIWAVGEKAKDLVRNLAPCCELCNKLKGAMTVQEFRDVLHESIAWSDPIVFWFENPLACGVWVGQP